MYDRCQVSFSSFAYCQPLMRWPMSVIGWSYSTNSMSTVLPSTSYRFQPVTLTAASRARDLAPVVGGFAASTRRHDLRCVLHGVDTHAALIEHANRVRAPHLTACDVLRVTLGPSERLIVRAERELVSREVGRRCRHAMRAHHE